MNVRELLIKQIGDLVLTNIEQAAAIDALQKEIERLKAEQVRPSE